MARRKKKAPGRKLLSPQAMLGAESRASVAVTVAWMLTILITGLAMFLTSALLATSHQADIAQDMKRNLSLLSNLCLLIALVTGPLGLILTVVVLRVRRDRPPLAVTLVAIVLGALPIALALLLM